MARKKTKSKKGIWAILLIIIAVFGLIFFQNQSFNLAGASILGVSNVQILSGDGLKEYFLFNAVMNGGGESISGIITSEDFENYGVDKIPKSFTMEFSLSNVSCNYRIESTDKSLFKVYQSTAIQRSLSSSPPYNSVNLQTTINWCNNGAPAGLPKSVIGIAPSGGDCSQMKEIGEWAYWSPEQSNVGSDGFGDWRVTHVGGIPFYTVEDIGTRGFLEYQVMVKITNSDGEVIETILNSKDQTANLGEYGRIKIVGNLQANEFCDIPAIKYSIVENSQGKKFVEKSWVDTYFNSYRNLVAFDNDYFEFQFRQQRIDPGVGADWIFGSISSMNNALNQISLQDLEIGCDIIGGSVSCKPETQVAYPELQVLLDTSYTGISKNLEAERQKILDEIQSLQQTDAQLNQARINALTEQLNSLRTQLVINIPTDGVPKIESITNNEVFANDVGTINVMVSNIGNQSDSFDVDLRCDNDISFGSKRLSLNPADKQTIDIKFNGNAGVYNCDIIAKSVNNPNNRDAKSLIVNIKDQPIPEQPEDLLDGTGSQTESDDYTLTIVVFLLIFSVIGAYYFKNRKNKAKKGKK